jgi:hypothetical protein
MKINKFTGMSCNLIAGLLMLVGIIILISNKHKISSYQLIELLFVLSIAIGIHGLNHYIGNDFTTVLENKNKD